MKLATKGKGYGRGAKTASAGLALLGRVVIGLMLVSGIAAAAVVHLGAANGATTTTTTTTNAFPVMINQPSFAGTATIVVSGTDPSTSQISVQIYNPRQVSMGIVTVATRENGSFSATFQAGWPTWDTSGEYSVVVTAPIADYVGTIPTSYLSFSYTAVPPTTTTSTSSPITTSSTTAPALASSVSLEDILPVVLAIVIAVALVGYVLSSRGQRRPRASVSPAAAPAPKVD